MSVAAIVLAAGASSRMGSPKPLLSWGDASLLGWEIDELGHSQIEDIVVVTGAYADDVRRALPAGQRMHCVFNARWAQGRSTSLAAGATALLSPSRRRPDAVVIQNVDQPTRADIIDRLVDELRSTGAEAVQPSYLGSRGHPVVVAGSAARGAGGGDRGAAGPALGAAPPPAAATGDGRRADRAHRPRHPRHARRGPPALRRPRPHSRRPVAAAGRGSHQGLRGRPIWRSPSSASNRRAGRLALMSGSPLKRAPVETGLDFDTRSSYYVLQARARGRVMPHPQRGLAFDVFPNMPVGAVARRMISSNGGESRDLRGSCIWRTTRMRSLTLKHGRRGQTNEYSSSKWCGEVLHPEQLDVASLRLPGSTGRKSVALLGKATRCNGVHEALTRLSGSSRRCLEDPGDPRKLRLRDA